MTKILLKTFYIVLATLFGALIFLCIFNNSIHNNSSFFLLLLTIVLLLFFGVLRFILEKNAKFVDRNYTIILVISLLLMGITQLSLGFLLRFTPSFDFDSVYGGAIQWLETGSFTSYYEYFYYFPNNLGSMTLLHTLFGVAKRLGITDYFSVGIVLNCLLSLLTMLVTSFVCKKLFGKIAGVLVLVFFACSLPFYVIASAFYTDALSMLYPILFYYLYLLYKEESTALRKIILLACMGIVISIGMMIKFTVIIMLLAVIIDGLFSKRFLETIKISSICVLFITCTTLLFNSYMYHTHLDKQVADEMNTPLLHWVMMGLNYNGGYNGEDYEFTRSIPASQRNEQLLKEIQRRFLKLGIRGTTNLWVKKALTCFGDGTYGLSDFLDDNPFNENKLQDYILYRGKNYDCYRLVCTSVLLAFYVLLVLGSIKTSQTIKLPSTAPSIKRSFLLAPPLAIFGLFLFLLFWEASNRYFTNFIPIIMLCGIIGLESLTKKEEYLCHLWDHFKAIF